MKTYSDKIIICLGIIDIIITATACVICMCVIANSISDGVLCADERLTVTSFSLILFILTAFLVLLLYAVNRLGCRIVYDFKSNAIYRTGFFAGYKYRLDVADIKEIAEVTFFRGGSFYVLFDSADIKYKSSLVKIRKSKKNKEFISLFWNKPIKVQKEPINSLL